MSGKREKDNILATRAGDEFNSRVQEYVDGTSETKSEILRDFISGGLHLREEDYTASEALAEIERLSDVLERTEDQLATEKDRVEDLKDARDRAQDEARREAGRGEVPDRLRNWILAGKIGTVAATFMILVITLSYTAAPIGLPEEIATGLVAAFFITLMATVIFGGSGFILWLRNSDSKVEDARLAIVRYLPFTSPGEG
jgi:predicted DNA-binding protein